MLGLTGLGKDGVEGLGTDVSIVLVYLGMGGVMVAAGCAHVQLSQ